jgi:hypothetical protein
MSLERHKKFLSAGPSGIWSSFEFADLRRFSRLEEHAMVTFFKAFDPRIFDVAGKWFSDRSSRLYGILVPMLYGTRPEDTERTISASPFIGLDGRYIDHEEERLVRLD